MSSIMSFEIPPQSLEMFKRKKSRVKGLARERAFFLAFYTHSAVSIEQS